MPGLNPLHFAQLLCVPSIIAEREVAVARPVVPTGARAWPPLGIAWIPLIIPAPAELRRSG